MTDKEWDHFFDLLDKIVSGPKVSGSWRERAESVVAEAGFEEF